MKKKVNFSSTTDLNMKTLALKPRSVLPDTMSNSLLKAFSGIVKRSCRML